MNNKYFTIQNFPDDVYNAVGQIIKNAQDMEKEYKKLATMLNVSVKNIDNSSLNKLNEALKKNNSISDKDFNNLKEVIKIRNYINHDFYLKDFQNSAKGYDKYIEELEVMLNHAQFLIFEATDVIDNKIDKLQGGSIVRPTIFD